MPEFIPVIIDSLRVSLTNASRVIILREEHGERYLPIWIGPFEAESITIALQEIELARPQTHDLMRNVIAALNGRLVRVEISALREDVFFADLIIETADSFVSVDARPSDAIAMAVRYQTPIFVEADVLAAAAFEPDPDISAVNSTPDEPIASDEPETSEPDVRLSVFEDFLGNLDLDEPDDDMPPEQSDDPDAPRA